MSNVFQAISRSSSTYCRKSNALQSQNGQYIQALFNNTVNGFLYCKFVFLRPVYRYRMEHIFCFQLPHLARNVFPGISRYHISTCSKDRCRNSSTHWKISIIRTNNNIRHCRSKISEFDYQSWLTKLVGFFIIHVHSYFTKVITNLLKESLGFRRNQEFNYKSKSKKSKWAIQVIEFKTRIQKAHSYSESPYEKVPNNLFHHTKNSFLRISGAKHTYVPIQILFQNQIITKKKRIYTNE